MTAQQQGNLGFPGLIVAVTALGGSLFGYYSGATNGTRKGRKLEQMEG